MKFAFNLIDKLMKNPTPLNLIALNKVFMVGIPFNAPHGFKIKEINDEGIVVTLPNRKLNHNHIGGVHACAMATAGEFCAGTSLLRSFGSSQYRFILAELHVSYTYQGREDLIGSCSAKQIDLPVIKAALEKDGKYLQPLKTIITNKSGKEVAVVTSTWQLKPWDQVKTKS